MKKSLLLASVSLLAFSGSASAYNPLDPAGSLSPNYENPETASWGGWKRGDANTAWAHWDVFTGVDGNTPDQGQFNMTATLDTTGKIKSSTNNLYSLNFTDPNARGAVDIMAKVGDLGTGPLTVALQVTDLNHLFTDTVKLNGQAWDYNKILFSGTANSNFGQVSVTDQLFVWNNVAPSDLSLLTNIVFQDLNHTTFTEAFLDIGRSVSPVSEPATLLLFGPALLGLVALGRKTKA